MKCFLDGAAYKTGDEKGWTIGTIVVRPPWFTKSEPTGITIPAEQYVDYRCSAEGLLQGVTINKERAALRFMRVRIAIDYKTSLLVTDWPRHYESPAFTWDLTPDGPKWYQGPLIP